MADENREGGSSNRGLARAGITAAVLVVGASAVGLTGFDSGETNARTPNIVTQTVTVSTTPQTTTATSQPTTSQTDAAESSTATETDTADDSGTAYDPGYDPGAGYDPGYDPGTAGDPGTVTDPGTGNDPGTAAPPPAAQPAAPESGPQTASGTGQQPSSNYPSDDYGFLHLTARCDGPQTAMAIGRTERSLLVICAVGNGNYEYRAIRLSDGATMTAPAEILAGGGWVAGNGKVKYVVLPQELTITENGNVYRREKMLEFRQPYTVSVGDVPPTPALPPTQPTAGPPAPGG